MYGSEHKGQRLYTTVGNKKVSNFTKTDLVDLQKLLYESEDRI